VRLRAFLGRRWRGRQASSAQDSTPQYGQALQARHPAASGVRPPAEAGSAGREQRPSRGARKPRVLFVGRTRYRLPLAGSLARKFEALGDELDVRVLASAANGSPTRNGTFTLVPPARPRALDGLLFYASLPVRVTRELRRFRPDAVVAQTAYEAAAVLLARRAARSRARLVLDVHADWRTSTRLYGSSVRRLMGPLGDRVAAAAVRRADRVRTVSGYTTGLVRELGLEPAGVFPAYMDLESFLGAPVPLPEAPRALFVGVLERYKNIDGLADAWRAAAPRVPGASLHVVGSGTLTGVVERLLVDVPARTEWSPHLSAEEVAAALDAATVLVLPSRSEGMGRVIVEAFCRGRAVLGTRVGGIVDLVADGVNGVLVEPGDSDALAEALVRLLSDRELAAALGEGARRSAAGWLQTPEQYAERVRALVSP
jgi:glycosyltransferase involved in cell wall biosynthesis